VVVDSQKKVFLVDDHLAFVEALTLAMEGSDDLRCIGTAATLEQALEAVCELEPDVVVLDLGLPDAQGVESLVRIFSARPDQQVLVLTGESSPEVLVKSVEAGAVGYLHKTASIAAVIDAVRCLPRHSVVVDRSSLIALSRSSSVRSPTPHGPTDLSPRELEVLGLLAAGHQPKSIATELGIALSTCRGYIKSLLVKLDAHTQLEAVSVGRRRHLIDR
jgi:DNA-binding NarL/FixJ family response regulator